MENSVFGTIILILTFVVTYSGFREARFLRKYSFHVDRILIGKEHFRMITSGFLHVGWFHFAFNMIALTSFCKSLEFEIGLVYLALLYIACIVGGSLLALFVHRNHGDYTAVGASGGVSGLVLAAVVLDPFGGIGFILIPISFTAWIFGFLYIIISIYAIRAQADNIGHEAHMGGALMGVIGIILIKPEVIFVHWWVILLMVVPIVAFIFVLIRHPEIMLVNGFFRKKKMVGKKDFLGVDPDKVKEKVQQKKGPTLDELLEKISKDGLESLTDWERKRLETHRRKLDQWNKISKKKKS